MIGTGALVSFGYMPSSGCFGRSDEQKRMCKRCCETGETIAPFHPDDKPGGSRLLLGWREWGSTPYRGLMMNAEFAETIAITAYEPSREEWELDFKKRRTDI